MVLISLLLPSAAAERGRKDRKTRARLRRRLTIACKAIRQIGEAALEADLMTGINGQNWRQWAEDAAHVAEGVGIDPSIEGLQQGVAKGAVSKQNLR